MGFKNWFNCWGRGPALSEDKRDEIIGRALDFATEFYAQRGEEVAYVELDSQPLFPRMHCGMVMIKTKVWLHIDRDCREHMNVVPARLMPHICPCCGHVFDERKPTQCCPD